MPAESRLPRIDPRDDTEGLHDTLVDLQIAIEQEPAIVAGSISMMLEESSLSEVTDRHAAVVGLVGRALDLTNNGRRLERLYDDASYDRVTDNGDFLRAASKVTKARTESIDATIKAERNTALVGLRVFLEPYLNRERPADTEAAA
ncbi:MAG TPA: hypothetical protein VLI54_04855 [Bacillota bacterium]|nr:hypothetical protein [Bacillota bacterium]